MKIFTVLLALLVAAPALALDYLGTDVTFGWAQPAGTVPEGWVVWVTRDGPEPVNEQTVTDKRVTISGNPDETISVKVQAYVGSVFSEMSPSSDPVTFRVLEAPTGVMIKCPPGQTFTEMDGGWWSCQ